MQIQLAELIDAGSGEVHLVALQAPKRPDINFLLC